MISFFSTAFINNSYNCSEIGNNNDDDGTTGRAKIVSAVKMIVGPKSQLVSNPLGKMRDTGYVKIKRHLIK
jgi:hypothetical protein